ncbi:L,D-transpeptidase family protein [Lysobacter enzymogenes]|uniref:L,D-transpeptidase family protein n=1 Tax=Lysobacter enzymogenes TaxID=69 RepID=UPI001A96DD9B|nr:hypothetical protein [Lysobacter enzymogenes]QQP94289.1 hypothetical protein JHW38_13510 [Lysobacter enzymogenes]
MLRYAAVLIAAAMTLTACATRADRAGDDAVQPQLVLVTTADWNATQGRLQRYLFEGGQWLAVGAPVEVSIGRNGAAWGRGLRAAPDDGGPRKKEGDGRAPAGLFAVGTAFGYGDSAQTAMAYAPMSASHYCIDVPDSPLYDRIVDARQVGSEAVKGSTEPMRRDLHADGDPRYRLGFVIAHNPAHIPGAGSCIFAHLWRTPGEPTAGCTAMDEAAMNELLAWLRPQARPLFALLPQAQYRAVWKDWGLPAPVAE